VEKVIETHESLAERTCIVFTVLLVILAALLVVPRLLKKNDTRLTTTILPLAFLVLYGGGALLLVNTAHNGGRLVHEFGVRAIVASPPANANTTTPVNAEQEND